MEQFALIPRVQAHRYTGQVYMLSTDLASFLGRRHTDILNSISRFLSEQPSLGTNFLASKYTVRGKKYNCFNITEQGVEHLMLRFTGSKPNQFKIAFVEAFNREREWVKNCNDAKTGSIEMCRALHDQREMQGKTTGAHHYINEHNLIYGVMFGAPVRRLVEQGRFSKTQSLIEQMTPREVQEAAELRNLEAKLLGSDLSFSARKNQLSEFHQHFTGDQTALGEQQRSPALAVTS